MIEISKIVLGFIILLGTALSLVTSIGLIRLPDVYTRSHAASKSATLGVLLILFAAFLLFGINTGHLNARLFLAIVFLFLTAPVAGHLLSRAAYHSNVPLWEKSVEDDLKKRVLEKKQTEQA
ncbi:Na+/H+ antiporter subunit G [Bacillus sp. HMF5848]|uniref:monovalent cation/H(+) antiporter subunit G n=1 Tax=Bacillus sp. HMF5848 TaxID=2495421 RepID=UPI000F7AB1DE|nr:Na+/H+ antiporter subunit G [Bacillus sp. HMF5848]